MSNNKPTNNSATLEQKIEKLESSVEQLIRHYNSLAEENDLIKQNNTNLMRERSELQLKNDKVRGQVEAMVERLKSMDKAT